MKARQKKVVKKASVRKPGVEKKTDAAEGSIPLFNMTGKEVGKFQLDKELFNGRVDKGVLYQAVRMYEANRRQGNASTKTRGDVSGGGKKPWRQKGTGRARAGSTRSPLWRHGGSVFGPHPRDYYYQIPKKVKRLALLSVLNSKMNDEKMIGMEDVTIQEPKTRKMKALLGALKLEGKTLFVLDKIDDNVTRAAANLQEVTLRNYKDFNTMDVLRCDTMVLSKVALEKLTERFVL